MWIDGDSMISEEDRIARGRFAMLSLVRLSAIVIAFVGAANIGGKLLPEFAPMLGQILFAVAAIDFFLAPALLKRAWRTRE
jgi:hypothetical protein